MLDSGEVEWGGVGGGGCLSFQTLRQEARQSPERSDIYKSVPITPHKCTCAKTPPPP